MSAVSARHHKLKLSSILDVAVTLADSPAAENKPPFLTARIMRRMLPDRQARKSPPDGRPATPLRISRAPRLVDHSASSLLMPYGLAGHSGDVSEVGPLVGP